MAWQLHGSATVRSVWAAVLVVMASTAPSLAQDSGSAGMDGRGLADACSSCHGIDGHSQGYIPSLAGMDRGTMVSMLKAFKAQTGQATIMNRIARGYSDAEFEALADYFSAVKSK